MQFSSAWVSSGDGDGYDDDDDDDNHSAAGEDGDGDSRYVRLCAESLACNIL